MFLYDSQKYYPVEICQIITREGKILYDRNKRRCAYCYIDLRDVDDLLQKGDV